MWRLMPFLFLLYIVAYLDRINVSYAILQMRGQLGLSDPAYGNAAAMFFLPCFLFLPPTTLRLAKVCTRRSLCGAILLSRLCVCSRRFILLPAVCLGLPLL